MAFSMMIMVSWCGSTKLYHASYQQERKLILFLATTTLCRHKLHLSLKQLSLLASTVQTPANLMDFLPPNFTEKVL